MCMRICFSISDNRTSSTTFFFLLLFYCFLFGLFVIPLTMNALLVQNELEHQHLWFRLYGPWMYRIYSFMIVAIFSFILFYRRIKYNHGVWPIMFAFKFSTFFFCLSGRRVCGAQREMPKIYRWRNQIISSVMYVDWMTAMSNGNIL